jgi:HEAT repeat protein
MRRMHIRQIQFSKGVNEHELKEFITMMMEKPEDLLERETFSQQLSKRGVSHIVVNEIRYAIVEDEAERKEDTLITSFLMGTISKLGIDMDEVLKEIFMDSNKTARLISNISPEENAKEKSLDPSQRAQVFTQNLERIINDLLIGRTGGWRQFKKNLAQMILGLDVNTQLEVLRKTIRVNGKEEELTKLFGDDIPDEKLAEIIARESLRTDITSVESRAFIESLVPDSKKRKELIPYVEKKLEEYGVSKEEFIKILMEEGGYEDIQDELPYEEIHYLIGKSSLEVSEIGKIAPFVKRLANEGRKSEAKILINKFFKAINTPNKETRKEVARLMPEMFRIIKSMAGQEGNVKMVTDYIRRKFWSENDPEVLTTLSESMDQIGSEMIQEGSYEVGLDLLELSLKGAEERGLAEDYVKRKQEILRGIIENKNILNEQIEIIREGIGGDQRRAINILKRLGKDAGEALVQALAEEGQMSKRMRLIRAIIEMGKQVIPFLKQALVSDKWYVVRNAVLILGEIRDEGTIKQIGAMLKHEEPRVRREAIGALLNIGSKKVEEMIIECLDDEDEGVRTKALDALISLRSKEAIPKLMEISKRGGGLFGAKETALRIKAIKALGALKAESAIPLLSDLLFKRGFFSKTEPDEIRRNAVIALATIGGDRAIKILEDVSRTDSSETIRILSDNMIKRMKKESISGR